MRVFAPWGAPNACLNFYFSWPCMVRNMYIISETSSSAERRHLAHPSLVIWAPTLSTPPPGIVVGDIFLVCPASSLLTFFASWDFPE